MKTFQRIRNRIGDVYGRLTVVAYGGIVISGKQGQRHSLWVCRCECGNVVSVMADGLPRTRSCGCLLKEVMAEIGRVTAPLRVKHGHASMDGRGKWTPEYAAWHAINQRCKNQKCKAYKNYGGRGIEVRLGSFEEFLAEVGLRPSPELSIDRINNDGHYEKGNLRWATRKQQCANSRRHGKAVSV